MAAHVQAHAFPRLWSEKHNGCRPPPGGRGGHPGLQPDDSITWVTRNATGAMVRNWQPGDYQIQVNAYEGAVNAWVYVSRGASRANLAAAWICCRC